MSRFVGEGEKVRTFEQAVQTNALIKAVLAAGGTAEDCCVILLNQLERTIERVIKLEGICPKKYLLQDGRTWVWRCPDELIPVTDFREKTT